MYRLLRMPPSQCLFYTMAIIGGFYGGFAIANFNVLGSAETTNMIRLVMSCLGGDLRQTFLCFVAAIIYGLAIVCSKLCTDRIKRHTHLVSVLINFVTTLWLCFAPEGLNYVLILYPMFFACAFQWNSFPGAKGFASSSIFSTNNYRQAILGLVDYLSDRENKSALEKSRFYFGTLLWFHVGAAAAFLSVKYLGQKGAAINLAFIVFAFAQTVYEYRYADDPQKEMDILVKQ